MRIVGLEQPRDRVAGTGRRIERGGTVAQARPGIHRVGAGDRVELAAADMQDHCDLHERLQARAEAAARPPRPLRDRAQPTMARRV